ncbi:MAG: MerR family transcriptional regulator [Planctomycetota bacterium]|jgi:methanogenic corrinoid protein MtbC1
MTEHDDLVSIGDVADATGVSAETLRMWERRYGRPRPVRLPSGHRRFTPRQVRWLRRVAEGLALGHRPGAVVPLGEEALDALLRASARKTDLGAETAHLLELARAFRGPEIASALRVHWEPAAPLRFLTEHVAPFLYAIGRQWADGDLGIRHEHHASEAVEDLLRELRSRYAPDDWGPAILLTSLSGERHGLGLHMAALVAASERCDVNVLGVDTPLDEIVRSARETDAALVGLSISLATGGVDTDREVAALRRALPDSIRLVVGGDGARGVRRGPRGVNYVRDLAAWRKFLRLLKDDRGERIARPDAGRPPP